MAANGNGRSERPFRCRDGCVGRKTGIRCRAMATRLRELSEAEAYARCYQSASDDVRVVKIPRRPRYQLDVSGEDLRAAFADRLDKREPELALHADLSLDSGLGLDVDDLALDAALGLDPDGLGLDPGLAAADQPPAGADATDPPSAAEEAA